MRRQAKVPALWIVIPEFADRIPGVFIRIDLAFKGMNFSMQSLNYKIHFIPGFVGPVKNISCDYPKHIKNQMLPEESPVSFSYFIPTPYVTDETGVEGIDFWPSYDFLSSASGERPYHI